MANNYALHILQAYKRIKSHIHETPVLTSSSLNRLAGAELYFKCENFQKCGSFKIRGAANQILQLEKPELGVCTHSSGNHGLGLAYMAKMANVKAHIIVPENSPAVPF